MPVNTNPTFAPRQGKLSTDLGSNNDVATSVVVQADGKILVAGQIHNGANLDIALVRYNADGSLDTTFDGDGKLTTAIGSGDDFAISVAVQADGRIVVGAQTGLAGVHDFAVVRYNSDGSLDTTFDGDGKLTTDFGQDDYARDMVLQADGKILIAGRTGVYSFHGNYALARYNANGTLDTTFDLDGKLVTDLNIGVDARSVALHPDGRIVVAGIYFNDRESLVRYNANGSRDSSFAGDGTLNTDQLSDALDVLVQPDGKIVGAGDLNGHLYVFRRNADGSPDTTFGGTGRVFPDVGGGDESVSEILRMPDGSIVVVGTLQSAPSASSYSFLALRYDANGVLDTTFDGDGWGSTSIQQTAFANGAALQADGKLVIAGGSSSSPGGLTNDLALARYNTDGLLDRGFGPAGPNTLNGSPSYYSGDGPVVLDGNVLVFDAELAAQGHYAGASVTLARHGGASAEDVYSATGVLGALTQGAALVYGGVAVGTVTTNSGGTLVLTFNGNATQARVDGVLQSIAYSHTTPAIQSVQIDWSFSDGNGSAQGTGGPLAATGSTTIAVGINHAPTFVVGSRVATDFGGSGDIAQSIVMRPDGRMLVAGGTNAGGGADFAILGFRADGALDTTFGGDGKTTTGIIVQDYARDIALQADGKAIVVGYTQIAGQDFDFALARYNVDGSLDTSFSGDGKVTTPIGGSAMDLCYAVAVQADGRIVAVGHTWNGQNYDFAVARYNTDGSLDTSFDADGKVVTDISSFDAARAVALQSDGKIVVAGWSLTGFFVARYNTNGSLDTSFDTDGKRVIDLGGEDQAHAVALQADGKILLAGFGGSPGAFAIVRLNADGTSDDTFDGDGIVVTPVGTGDSLAYDIAVQPDGKIVVAGTNRSGGLDRVAIVRYNADGSLDTSFDEDGKATTAFSSMGVAAITLQSDGKIMAVGTTGGSSWDFIAARYNSDGTLDATFGPRGNSLSGAPTFVENGAPVVMDSNVRVYDAELLAQGHYGGATFTLARRDGASTQDVFSATGALGALTQGGALTYSGVNIGTVTTNAAGTLVLTFNANATQARVDGVLQAIAYSNASDAPPGSVRLDWNLSDGNGGAQGPGGPLSAVGSKLVNIQPATDTYLWSSLTDGQVIEFGPQADRLRFDDAAISAADVSVTGATLFSHGGKTVRLETSLGSLTTSSVIFDGGGQLIVGDNTTATLPDAGANTVAGGAGNDRLMGLGANDALNGRSGADALDGGTGTDFASYASAASGVTARLHAPASNTGEAAGDTYISIEGLIGSNFNDTLGGDSGANELQGLDGTDSLSGRDGADRLKGGAGNDNLYGDAGADALDGGADFDYARYDTASAGVRADLGGAIRGLGDAAGDTFTLVEGLVGSAYNDTLLGDALANTLQGRDGTDSLYGRAGADTLQGGAGIDNLYGEAGADHLDGGADFDWARYDTAPAGVRADLSGAIRGLGDAAGDTFTLVEGLVGSAFDDLLLGDTLANTLQGRDGTDSLYGRAGADTLQGGAGIDNLYGEAGADHLDGGADFDWARYDTALAAVTADLSGAVAGAGDAAGDTFTLVERLVGSGFDDQLFGDALANTLQGRDGADTLVGRAGSDTLQGGNGNDDLDGGAGQDLLLGDAGNDKFRFTVGEANGDRVQDFNGNGVLAGDELVFQGYGLGATFIQTSPNTGEIHYGITSVETISFVTPTVVGTDYTFI